MIPLPCCIRGYLLLYQELYLLLLAHQLMEGYQIVFEDIEQQVLLFEYLDANGLLIVAVAFT